MVIDLPEGSVGRGHRCGGPGRRRRPRWRSPRSPRPKPMPAPRRRSTSTGWCGTTTSAQSPELGDVHVALLPKDERKRESHAVALELRAAAGETAGARGHQPEGGRNPARPAGAGDAAGGNLRPRPRDPPQGRRRRSRRSSPRCPISSMSTTASAPPPAGSAPSPRATTWSSTVSRKAMSSTRWRILGQGRTVGYSHRGEGRAPIPIVHRTAQGQPGAGDRGAGRAGAGQRPAGRPRRGRAGRRGPAEAGDRGPIRSTATTPAPPRW